MDGRKEDMATPQESVNFTPADLEDVSRVRHLTPESAYCTRSRQIEMLQNARFVDVFKGSMMIYTGYQYGLRCGVRGAHVNSRGGNLRVYAQSD